MLFRSNLLNSNKFLPTISSNSHRSNGLNQDKRSPHLLQFKFQCKQELHQLLLHNSQHSTYKVNLTLTQGLLHSNLAQVVSFLRANKLHLMSSLLLEITPLPRQHKPKRRMRMRTLAKERKRSSSSMTSIQFATFVFALKIK